VQDSATGKYLLALAVGYDERANINATVHKVKNHELEVLSMFLM
jgi:hypothetical protein